MGQADKPQNWKNTCGRLGLSSKGLSSLWCFGGEDGCNRIARCYDDRPPEGQATPSYLFLSVLPQHHQSRDVDGLGPGFVRLLFRVWGIRESASRSIASNVPVDSRY